MLHTFKFLFLFQFSSSYGTRYALLILIYLQISLNSSFSTGNNIVGKIHLEKKSYTDLYNIYRYFVGFNFYANVKKMSPNFKTQQPLPNLRSWAEQGFKDNASTRIQVIMSIFRKYDSINSNSFFMHIRDNSQDANTLNTLSWY